MTWSDEKTGHVEECLIHFGVVDDVDETTVLDKTDNDLKKLGLTAADWFDITCTALSDVLENTTAETRTNTDNFQNIVEFVCADNCKTNVRPCSDSVFQCLDVRTVV